MREYLRTHALTIANVTAGLMFALQLLNLHSYPVQTADHEAIVAVNDDDSAWNIAKTVKTRWWKDNGWVLYGPLYFRLNHSVQYFWGRTAEPMSDAGPENWERTAYLSVMTLSLVSLAAVSLIVASMFVAAWWARFLCAMALLSALLTSPVWCEMLLRAHPDHMFTFFVVSATFFVARMLEDPGNAVWRKISAVLYGFAMSVKMSLILSMPGFLFLFIPPVSRDRLMSGLRYLGWMLAAYFLIGIAQSHVLDRPFREMRTLGSVSTAPTGESVAHLIHIYGEQTWRPLLVLLAAALFLPRYRRPLKRETLARLTIFVILPFLLLLGKNMLVPFDHYAMPFIGLLLLFAAMLIAQLAPIKLGTRGRATGAAVFVALFLALLGSTPVALQTELERHQVCRAEAREVYARIKTLYKAGARVWVDPYVPYISTGEKARMNIEWHKTWTSFKAGGWNVLALNSKFRQQHLIDSEPSEYIRNVFPDWRALRDFYRAFNSGPEATTPEGQVFHRTYQDGCGMEIWEF